MAVKSKRATAAIAGAAGAVALSIAALIKPWEGRELKAYKDIVGVWTICDGETKGVKPADQPRRERFLRAADEVHQGL
jgi:lysozyme